MPTAFAPAGYEKFSILDTPLRMPEEGPAPAIVARRRTETIADLPSAAPGDAQEREWCRTGDDKEGKPLGPPPIAPPLFSTALGTGRAVAVRAAVEMNLDQSPVFNIFLAAPDPETVTRRYTFGEPLSGSALSLMA